MTQKSFFWTNGRSLKFFRFPNQKNFSHSNHSTCSFENFGQISDFFSRIFRAEFFKISGQSWIHFSGHVRRFSGIRRAVRGAVATFFSMEVSMPVPVWHHLVQKIVVNADHQAYLIVANACVSNFDFLVWRQMFLQALLLPSPIQRSFLQTQEDIVKGCKAKCVERANESKYQNLGPFFSQGENGPEVTGRKKKRFFRESFKRVT